VSAVSQHSHREHFGAGVTFPPLAITEEEEEEEARTDCSLIGSKGGSSI
jgi:hypothetical protein